MLQLAQLQQQANQNSRKSVQFSSTTKSSGKENGVRQAARVNIITQQKVSNSKERKIAQLRAQLAMLEGT